MARSHVEQRLAACVNILEVPVYSIYRWKGKIETAKETLLIIKSSRKRFGALQNAIKKLHSYDVPEIIALPIERRSRDYLAWLGESVSPSRISRRIHT
jgi:periplasmic divalent cation tolerance protein